MNKIATQLELPLKKEEPTITLRVKHCKEKNRHAAHLHMTNDGRRVCPGDTGIGGE